MAKKIWFYSVLVSIDGHLRPFDGLEYTVKQAKEIVNQIRDNSPELRPCLKPLFWKYTTELSIKNHH